MMNSAEVDKFEIFSNASNLGKKLNCVIQNGLFLCKDGSRFNSMPLTMPKYMVQILTTTGIGDFHCKRYKIYKASELVTKQ